MSTKNAQKAAEASVHELKSDKAPITASVASLTPIETVVISKIIPEKLMKAARTLVPSSETTGSFTVRIDYAMKVEPDGEARPTSQILSLPALCIALKKSGLQRENIMAVLTAAVEVATANGQSTAEELREAHPELKSIEDELKTLLDTLPKLPKKGGCHITGTVTRI